MRRMYFAIARLMSENSGAVEEVMEKLEEKGIEIDILINNAGKSQG